MAGPQFRSTPFPRNYKPISGDVAVPNPDDPVDVQQLGRDTYFDFGMGTREPAAAVPSGSLVQGLRELILGKQPIPPAPPMPARPAMPAPSIGDLRMMDERALPAMPPVIAKPTRPTESYGTTRGGFGGAGRGGPQFGKSQFDVQTYTPPEMSIADLRMLDDKPWDLDENTNADVQAGTSLTPKPEQNVVDKEPDLQTPQGLYQALAKKYPDILQQNLDDLQKSRVSMEDVDALRDRGGMGSLFIAASKAASGAGSIGGKTAESIAPAIVQREDTLARQQLKDRMDVASENMAMNAKAVDLAMKQINFADEREQYDPNSEVSRFARDFMREEFQVNVPDNVPAYQLKQFLPAVVQKYQAEERAKYQAALLGQRTEENLLNDAYKRYETATRSGDKKAQIDAQKEIARLREMKKAEPKAPKPEKTLGGVEKSVADAEFKIADKFGSEPAVKKYKTGAIALQEMESLAKQESAESDQGLINGYAKILDPESVVREGEYATVAKGGGILNQIKNAADVSLGRARLQPAQRQKLLEAARALQRGRQSEYSRIRSQYEERARQYGLDPQRSLGAEDVSAPSGGQGGLSPEKKARLEELRRKLRGGQ